jgi:uncharacterized protein YggE
MRTITVVGYGTAHATPDTAEVRVATVHRDAGVSEALAGAESARESVVATSRRYLEPSHVASTDLRVWPVHDLEGRPSGFEARHSLTIRCDGLDQAGALVSALAADVGHRLQVESVQLVVADSGDAVGRAREDAFADARLRGEHLAALAGATLGQLQAITEGGAGRPVAFTEADMAVGSATSEASFEPGETAVSTSLTLTYEIAPAG